MSLKPLTAFCLLLLCAVGCAQLAPRADDEAPAAVDFAQGGARAVVINEIFYHAPDDLHGLQFIELHNTAEQPVDLSGWKIAKGVSYQFPAKTTIEANGFLVVCKDRKEFKKHYGFEAAGQFEGSLKHNNDQIELLDAAGKKIDSVKYGSRSPWPVAADGYGASLERICPTLPGNDAANWAPLATML